MHTQTFVARDSLLQLLQTKTTATETVLLVYHSLVCYRCGHRCIRLTYTTILWPFSGTTQVSRCQKITSGLYGARED